MSAVIHFCDQFVKLKIHNYKNSDMKNFICNQYGEKLAILNIKNIKICR